MSVRHRLLTHFTRRWDIAIHSSLYSSNRRKTDRFCWSHTKMLTISYPEPSLSGSGHTGLKNDPDWSIHKLLDPYPLWRSRARPIWVNTIYFALFGLKICLFWRIFCCFSSEKVVKGLRSWFMHTWIHLGKITGFVMVIIHTLRSLWVSILMGMMAYVLDLLYWSVIIENKFKRTRLASVHVCYDCVCTRFGIF